jgi:hypothetical protein
MPNVARRSRNARRRRPATSKPKLTVVPMPAAQDRPVRGIQLKTVSMCTLIFALLCVAAFAAGRPPAAGMGPSSVKDLGTGVSHRGKAGSAVSRSLNRHISGQATQSEDTTSPRPGTAAS